MNCWTCPSWYVPSIPPTQRKNMYTQKHHWMFSWGWKENVWVLRYTVVHLFSVSTSSVIFQDLLSSWNYSVSRTEVIICLSGTYSEPLTKRSNLQGGSTIWKTSNPLRTGNSLFSVHALQLREVILGAHYTPLAFMMENTLPPVFVLKAGFS